jgi:hypothetical protein
LKLVDLEEDAMNYRQLLSSVLVSLSILLPVMIVLFTLRRNSFREKSPRLEITICILLISMIFLAWMAFVMFLGNISDEIASMNFIRRHIALGEDPEWVLNIAGAGIPQPLDAIITWRWFQWGMIIFGVLETLLAWLGARLWKGQNSQ